MRRPGAVNGPGTRTPRPGLAFERTVLAFNRSGLAALVCVAVLLRHLWPLRDTGQRVALGLLAVAAIVWAIGVLAVSSSSVRSARARAHTAARFKLMTTATVMLAVRVPLTFFAPTTGCVLSARTPLDGAPPDLGK